MAEELESFEYGFDEIDGENDFQKKKFEENNRENINKITKTNHPLKLNVDYLDEDYYNENKINNFKGEINQNSFESFVGDEEDVQMDDFNGEFDNKNSQNNPIGRPIYDNINKNSHSENNEKSINEIKNYRYYNNSVIDKSIFEDQKEISQIGVSNLINNNKIIQTNQLSDRISIDNIIETRTPKSSKETKNNSYMNLDNYYDESKNLENHFDNLTQIQNNEIGNLEQNKSFISNKMPSVLEINSKMLRSRGYNNLSKLQYAESKYQELINYYENIKNNYPDYGLSEIRKINNLEKEKILESLSKQNFESLKCIESLNKIINIIIDGSKNQIKNAAGYKLKKFSNNIQFSNLNDINNNKLLEVFKKEYIKLEQRYHQISNPIYEEKLEETLADLKDKLNYYLNENKKLEITQKQTEAVFERQYKNNNLNLQTKNLEINKVNIDYDNTRRLNESVLEKIQKNKLKILENEQKFKEINEWLNKLGSIARDMYGITDFIDKENIKKIEQEEKEKIDLKFALKKKKEKIKKNLF